MKHSFYCKIDVYLGAEMPSPVDMKSLELNKMLLISSLFWAPVANCVFPRPVHTLPAQSQQWKWNEGTSPAAILRVPKASQA